MRARTRVLHVLLHAATLLQNAASQGACGKNREYQNVFLGILECRNCQFGKYNDDGNRCVSCPQNTMVSFGRYDSSISDWCEPDCFKVWRDFLALSASDKTLFIASFSSYPCIRAIDNEFDIRAKCSSGHADCKNLASRCNSVDDLWAQSSVVELEEGVVWEKAMLFANLHRRCVRCKKGKYKDPVSKTCIDCPSGFAVADFETKADFIPEDVKSASRLKGIINFPPTNYIEFGCRACSVYEGVGLNGECQKCSALEYQLASIQTFKIANAEYNIFVGIKCTQCPRGYEMWNLLASSREVPCRGLDFRDCCRPCAENYFSSGGEACRPVEAGQVGYSDTSGTFCALGASSQKTCAKGEELVYCTQDGCDTSRSTVNYGWRTCKSCSLSGTKYVLNKNCEECSVLKKDKPNGEGICYSCSLCEKLELTPVAYALHTIPRDVLESSVVVPKFADSYGVYYTTKISAECVPLARRTVSVDGTSVTISGVDQYRKGFDDPNVYVVSRFETVFRDHTGSVCRKVPCSELCAKLYPFHYSPACGITPTDEKDIWVYNGSLTVALTEVTDLERKRTGMNVANSPCMLCTPCLKGYFNYGCNVYNDGPISASGQCRECTSQCDVGMFMHHPDGDGKCHFPSLIMKHLGSVDLWKVDTDYVCKKCPTWVLEKHASGKMTMSTATACGLRTSYDAYNYENNNLVSDTHEILEWKDREADEKKMGVKDWLKYRSFMRDLIAYCPREYFFDNKEQDCDDATLRREGYESYTVPGTDRTVTYGFHPYSPKCCKRCKGFDPLMFKKGADWELCPGNTTEDVQNRYVYKCGRGYYENKNTSQCLKCSTCHEGMIQP